MRKINESNDIKNPNTYHLVKFYYNLLKQRQEWIVREISKKLKNITVLLLINTIILLAIIIIWLYNQSLFYSRLPR